MRACTTVSRRDVPRARVLAESYTKHHPGERLHVLVTDDVDRAVDPAAEPFDLCRPDELPLEDGEFRRMAAIYDPKEFVTAAKFWQIRLLLQDDDTVLFLDSDVEVFASLTELGQLCAERGVVVTPHSVDPIPLDGETPSELQIQRSGIYNTGFIGVGAGSGPFLDWMCERARRDCILDRDAGLWFDQRWFDFVPLFFEGHVCRDRSYNVAYWNLHERGLDYRADQYEVDGRPLSFFHFSGFDPHRPELLTRVATRIRPVAGSPLGRLCREYAEKLLAEDYDDYIDVPYGLERFAGVTWTPQRRRRYRRALIAVEREGAPPPPEPGDRGFATWLRFAPVLQAARRRGVRRS